MSLFFMLPKGGTYISYQVTDEAIISTAPEGETVDLWVIFQANGTVFDRVDLGVGGTSLTESDTSPWSTDDTEDGVGKHIRINHVSGVNAYDGSTPAENVWDQISDSNILVFQDPDTSGPYDRQSTYTIELSLDGGSTTHDTMTLTVNLVNEGP